MPENKEIFARLQELLDASLDGAISPAEVNELESLLRGDPDAQQFYLDYVGVHTDLYLLLSVMDIDQAKVTASGLPADASTKPAPALGFLGEVTQRLTTFAGHHPWFSLFATVAMLSMVVLGVQSWMTPEPSPVYLAQVNEIRDCQWAEGSVQPQSGSVKLAEGAKLELKSGLAEVVYGNGAKVLLQGPVKFDIQANNAGFLREGKLTATANSVSSHGFTIYTPAARFSDLGTEFGVQVDAEGRAAVAVFVGKVHAEAKQANGSWAKPLSLREGEGAVCEKASFTRQAANRSDFPSLEGPPPPPPPAPNLVFQRWTAMSQELQKRPDAIAYYDFQPDPNNPQTLLNRAASGATRNGEIQGATWVEGRCPGKSALEFKQSGSGVKVDLSGNYPQMTLIAWVRLEKLENDMNALLMSVGWLKAGQLHWQITRDGRLVLREPSMANDLTSEAKLTPDRFQQWCMVAAVIDVSQHSAAYYLDGEPIGNPAANDFQNTINFGPATIGNWDQTNYTEPDQKLQNRSFQGRIDELAVLQSLLPPEDIRRIYESGKP